MLTPFNIYLIMQLDRINNALVAPAILLTLMTVIGFVLMLVNTQVEKAEPYTDPWYHIGGKIFRRAGLAATIVFLLLMLLPSSRSAAVIVILPAIANNEAVQREANDLYQLAKQGLKNLVEQDDDNARQPPHDATEQRAP